VPSIAPAQKRPSHNLRNYLKSRHQLPRHRACGDPGARSLVQRRVQQTTEQLPFTQRLDWVVVAARAPLDRQYEAIGFTDVFSDRGYVAMAHAGGVPHRVLALPVASAEAMIAAAHPMATTLFLTHHPDIDIAPPS
jgi:hypothetical protein